MTIQEGSAGLRLHRSKYPRTYHLPWSESKTSDDKTFSQEETDKIFKGKKIVVTEKLDGENTTIYSDGYCHARSIDSKDHESRSYVKSLAAKISHQIPENWRLLGENLYAKHSIEYDGLPDYFILFGIVDNNENSLSWSNVEEYAKLLDLHTAPVLYSGIYDEDLVKSLKHKTSSFGKEIEGYVLRTSDSFPINEFGKNVAKFVRKNHVQTDQHWMFSKITPNKIRK